MTKRDVKRIEKICLISSAVFNALTVVNCWAVLPGVTIGLIPNLFGRHFYHYHYHLKEELETAIEKAIERTKEYLHSDESVECMLNDLLEKKCEISSLDDLIKQAELCRQEYSDRISANEIIVFFESE